MNIAEQFSYDIACMREYFRQLFIFAKSTTKPFIPELFESNVTTQFLPFGIAHLIRPDMVCNIYSLIDFWLANLCAYHQKRAQLQITFEEFKKKKHKTSDLNVYKKYLTEIASLDLSAVDDSFHHLDALRKVRNCFIHSGGHASEKNRIVFASIPGVSINMSLVIVTEAFIWQSIDHTNQYIQAIASA